MLLLTITSDGKINLGSRLIIIVLRQAKGELLHGMPLLLFLTFVQV